MFRWKQQSQLFRKDIGMFNQQSLTKYKEKKKYLGIVKLSVSNDNRFDTKMHHYLYFEGKRYQKT